MNKILLFSAFSTALFLGSCKKDRPDTIAPSVFLVRVNGAAESGTAAAGSTITFYAEIKDNVNLKQFKVDIHDAFDGHDDRNTPYSVQYVYSISGTAAFETKSISIPATASSGPYHIKVTALDEAGMESNIYQYDLTVTQTGQPVINITSHNLDSLYINAGDTLNLAGTVTDDVDIDSVNIYLENPSGTNIYSQLNGLPGAADVLYNVSSAVTGATTSGTYILIIRASDNDGNMTIIRKNVNVQ